MSDYSYQKLEGLRLALQHCTKYEDRQFLNFMIRKCEEAPLMIVWRNGEELVMRQDGKRYVLLRGPEIEPLPAAKPSLFKRLKEWFS